MWFTFLNHYVTLLKCLQNDCKGLWLDLNPNDNTQLIIKDSHKEKCFSKKQGEIFYFNGGIPTIQDPIEWALTIEDYRIGIYCNQ